MRLLRFGMTILLGFLSQQVCAGEEPLTERERMLLDKIESLEKRVEELEKGLASRPAPAPEQDTAESVVPPVTAEAKTEPPADPNELQAVWKDGLRFETRDGRFKLKIGGRLQSDAAWIDQDTELDRAFGKEDDGVEFRRAYIDLRGDIYDDVFYMTQFDFAGDDGLTKFRDVYVGLRNIPRLGTLTVGHYKEPFGLEQLTSDNYLVFLEHSLTCTFTPQRNFGAMASNSAFDGRLAWAAGFFKETDDFPSDDDSDEDQGAAVTARVSGLPWYTDEGRRLLHLGLAYSHRNPDGALVRYKQRPESHLANVYLDTERFVGYRISDLRADDVDLYGVESVLIHGPFSVQGEHMTSRVDTSFGGALDFSGYYVYATYLLTGENRRYKLGEGVFDRIVPVHNFAFGEGGGWGAWELALRYSSLDLDNGLVRGGEEDNWSFAVNWYLNPNTRVMLDYTLADIEHDLYEGRLGILQTRFQVDF